MTSVISNTFVYSNPLKVRALYQQDPFGSEKEVWAEPVTQPRKATVKHGESAAVIRFYRELREIAQLEDNWDGYGAAGVSQRVHLNARKIVQPAVDHGLVPDVSPTTAGTVEFDWQVGSIQVSIEVGSRDYSVIIWKNSVVDQTELRPIEDYGDLGHIWRMLDSQRTGDSLYARVVLGSRGI